MARPPRTCHATDCGRPVRARNLCARHYEQQRRGDYRSGMLLVSWGRTR